MRRAALHAFLGSALLGAAGLTGAPALAQDAPTPSARGAIVYFHHLRDGQRLPRKFWVRIGLKEMGIAPAGVKSANTGHHHVVIDSDLPPAGQPIPSDFNHIHLGNGQTEVELTLTPGQHTLQLLLGDHAHVPHVPAVRSPKITVTVE
jgi:hypothetical protein